MSVNVRNTNNTRNNPFVPYWKYEIKWALLKFKDEIRELDPKLKTFLNGGWGVFFQHHYLI